MLDPGSQDIILKGSIVHALQTYHIEQCFENGDHKLVQSHGLQKLSDLFVKVPLEVKLKRKIRYRLLSKFKIRANLKTTKQSHI